jgi:hypothetical protein
MNGTRGSTGRITLLLSRNQISQNWRSFASTMSTAWGPLTLSAGGSHQLSLSQWVTRIGIQKSFHFYPLFQKVDRHYEKVAGDAKSKWPEPRFETKRLFVRFLKPIRSHIAVRPHHRFVQHNRLSTRRYATPPGHRGTQWRTTAGDGDGGAVSTRRSAPREDQARMRKRELGRAEGDDTNGIRVPQSIFL